MNFENFQEQLFYRSLVAAPENCYCKEFLKFFEKYELLNLFKMEHTTKRLQFLVDVRLIKVTRSHDSQQYN